MAASISHWRMQTHAISTASRLLYISWEFRRIGISVQLSATNSRHCGSRFLLCFTFMIFDAVACCISP